VRIKVSTWWRKPWVRVAAGALIACVAGLCVATTYYYVGFARIIDQRLHGERDRVLPRVFARPLEIRRGQSMSNRQLIDRLNELGYAQRPAVEKAGEFSDTGSVVSTSVPPPPPGIPSVRRACRTTSCASRGVLGRPITSPSRHPSSLRSVPASAKSDAPWR
jgi:hypothetical protein